MESFWVSKFVSRSRLAVLGGSCSAFLLFFGLRVVSVWRDSAFACLADGCLLLLRVADGPLDLFVVSLWVRFDWKNTMQSTLPYSLYFLVRHVASFSCPAGVPSSAFLGVSGPICPLPVALGGFLSSILLDRGWDTHLSLSIFGCQIPWVFTVFRDLRPILLLVYVAL